MENIRGFDLPDIHALNTRLKIIAEEVSHLRQTNKEQQKTLKRVNNFLGQFCPLNGQQQSYTASNNNFKRKKIDVDITGEDTDYVYVKPGVSNSKLFEELFKSKVVKIFF